MCENNLVKIIEEINKLSNEEATEILNNYTNIELMTLINHKEAFDEHMKLLSENMLKMSRIMTGLYKVVSEMHGLNEIPDHQEDIDSMEQLVSLLADNYEVWEYAHSLNSKQNESPGTH